MGAQESQSRTSATTLELARDPRLLAIVLVSSFATWGTFVVSPILPELTGVFGVSDARIGLLMSAYTLPVIVFAPIGGMLGDRIGRRIVILLSLALFGAAGTAIAFVTAFDAVLILRALQGVAFAGLMPIALTLIGDLYTGPEGASAQGIRFGANAITGVAVPPIAAAMVAVAWTYPFFLYLAYVPVMAILYRSLPSTYAAQDDTHGTLASVRDYWRHIGAEIRRPSVFVAVLGGFLTSYVFFELFTFVPLYAVRSLGATSGAAALILSTIGFQILVSPLSGRLVRLFGRRAVIMGTLSVVIVAHLLVPQTKSLVTFGALVMLVLTTEAVFGPVLEDYLVSSITPEHRSGIMSGYQAMKNVGKTTAPLFLGGVLAVFGFEWVFYSTAGLLAAYALLAYVTIEGQVPEPSP